VNAKNMAVLMTSPFGYFLGNYLYYLVNYFLVFLYISAASHSVFQRTDFHCCVT